MRRRDQEAIDRVCVYWIHVCSNLSQNYPRSRYISMRDKSENRCSFFYILQIPDRTKRKRRDVFVAIATAGKSFRTMCMAAGSTSARNTIQKIDSPILTCTANLFIYSTTDSCRIIPQKASLKHELQLQFSKTQLINNCQYLG